MADPRKRLPENAPGGFFVDSTCIDCDQCRQIAPSVFRDSGEFSVVHRQPIGPQETLRAEMALVTCPTASIGVEPRRDLGAAVAAFPERVEDDVFFCGFASEKSFGGSSWLVVRPEGNVLIDSPRFSEPLVKRIEKLGGLRWIVLTHQDDVADHDRWQERFGARRVMHGADAAFDVELRIEGSDPHPLDKDLLVIPTPGHTRGHLVLLYRDRFLFSGDHVWGDPEGKRLEASHRYCWHSWGEQRRSMERLLGYRFEWILPGHGVRARLPQAEMRKAIEDLVARMAG